MPLFDCQAEMKSHRAVLSYALDVKNMVIQYIATLGPEERLILSQRDRRMGRRVVLYSSVSQPASHPASHPDRLTSQNIQNWITHQPMVGSSPNFKLKRREPNQNGIKSECKKVWNEDDLQWKMTSKYKKNISATTGWILIKFETEAIGIK